MSCRNLSTSFRKDVICWPHRMRLHNQLYRKQVENYMIRHKVKPALLVLRRSTASVGNHTLDKWKKEFSTTLNTSRMVFMAGYKRSLKQFLKGLSEECALNFSAITGIVIDKPYGLMDPEITYRHCGYFQATLQRIMVIQITSPFNHTARRKILYFRALRRR